jgi:hypothetical protein
MLLHHAYLYEGSSADFETVAKAARTMLGFSAAATPDVIVRLYDKFGIDDSRELVQMASLRSVGEKSLFVLGISQITTEAQQAMLKLLEEPRQGLTFVILMPHGVILPTLRSRMQEFPKEIKGLAFMSPDSKAKPFISFSACDFLAASPKERSDMLAKMLKADDAREQLRTLLNEMESLVYTSKKAERLQALQEIAAMRPYLSDRSPSLKMIGEHLAAVLPNL